MSNPTNAPSPTNPPSGSNYDPAGRHPTDTDSGATQQVPAWGPDATQQLPVQPGVGQPTQPLPPYNANGATVLAAGPQGAGPATPPYPVSGPSQHETYGQPGYTGTQPGYNATQPAYNGTQPTYPQPGGGAPNGPGGQVPPSGAGTPPPKRRFPVWGWIVAGLLALALISGIAFAAVFASKPQPAATTATSAPVSGRSASAPTSTGPSKTKSASSSPATRTASASASNTKSSASTAPGAPTSFQSLKDKSVAAGITCTAWQDTDSSGLRAQTCVTGADRTTMIIYSSSLPLVDDFWKGFSQNYPATNAYVVTDKNTFGVATTNKTAADKLAADTGATVYSLVKDKGLAPA